MRINVVVRVLKRRGGMIESFDVYMYTSFTDPTTNKAQLTIRGAMVLADCHDALSAFWKLTEMRTIPETRRKRPAKSDSRAASITDRRLVGLRWREKNKMIAAAPPVGRFIQKHQRHETWSASTPPTYIRKTALRESIDEREYTYQWSDDSRNPLNRL